MDGLTRASRVDPAADAGAGAPDAKADASAVDSAAPDAAPAVNGFSGAGAYASDKPPTTAAQAHKANNVAVTPNKSAACLSCHGPNGNAPLFLFAGSVYQDKAGTTPAVDVEVRVRGNDGAGYSAHSDADGNFWYVQKQGDSIVATAYTGARDGSKTSLMNGGLAQNVDCNGCHGGGTTDPVHLP